MAYFGLAYAASWVGLEVRCEMEVKWVHHETRVLASKGINLIHVEEGMWSYGSRQLAVAGRSLGRAEPNPIHGQLLVLV